MHNAPAVSFPVGRSRFQGWLLGLISLIAVLVDWLWCFQTDSIGWRQGLFLLILLAALVDAVLVWQRTPTGSLRWDGQVWSWIRVNDPVSGVLTVHFDLQFCLILSLRQVNGVRIWLWIERRADVTRWVALRRAVFAHVSGRI
jgi:toxin CptA